MASGNNGAEPSSAPQPDRWYTIKLGSSFKDNPTAKFCTLRYEFKPASIDKTQAGTLHKSKDNRVTVEFPNNQPGKPKVAFEGSSEEYKDHDGVLFFDGETFRLERLHRAVKRLRHVRVAGESSAAVNMAAASTAGASVESLSPPLGKVTKHHPMSRTIAHSVPVEVERINIGEPESSGPKLTNKSSGYQSTVVNPFPPSPDTKPYEIEENLDIVGDDDDYDASNKAASGTAACRFDMNIPNQVDTDDEIADVDENDEADEGVNAAEALRAQVNAEEGQQERQETSSSSDGSGTGSGSSSSGTGSGSSSSGSDGSDADSASFGGDVDI